MLIRRCRVLAILGMAILFTGCGTDDAAITESVSGATPAPDASAVARDAQVAAIYAAAQKHDEARLLSAQVQSPRDPAVALALYALDPAKYADAFVAAYPSRADAVENDYGTRLEHANLEPSGSRFPVDALASFARGGNPLAVARLFAALANAGPTTASLYRSAALAVVHAKPQLVLPAIDTLPPPERVADIGDPLWCVKGAADLPIPTPTPAPPPSPGSNATAAPTSTPDAIAIATLAGITTTRDRSCAVAVAPPRAGKHGKRSPGKPASHVKSGKKAKAAAHPARA